MRDVDAAVGAARADGADAVVTVGLSMGGGAALRQAALGRHRPDAVVSVSAVSRWYVRDTRPMRRVHWLLETTAGRTARLAGCCGCGWTSRGSPRRCRRWRWSARSRRPRCCSCTATATSTSRSSTSARSPRRRVRAATAWVVPGFGHAESGVDRSARRADRTLGFCDDRPVTFPSPGVRAAGPGAPPARRRRRRGGRRPAGRRCPSSSGTSAGWPRSSCCSSAWSSRGCWSPASRASPGSLTVGAAAAVAADLVLVLPARPAMGGLLDGVRGGLRRRGAAADAPAAPAGAGRVAGRCRAAARRDGVRWPPCCCSGATDAGHGRALVALLAVGAALVVVHLVDLVLPRPQLADGVPCGLLGLVLAVVAGAAVTYLGRDIQRHRRTRSPPSSTARSLGGVAAIVSPRRQLPRRRGRARPSRRRASSRHRPGRCPLIQGVLPLAACGSGGPRPADRALTAMTSAADRRPCCWSASPSLADRIACGVAEDRVATELAAAGGLAGTPEVEITGFPFLTQAVGGSYDEVRISLTADELGQPEGTRADVVAARRAGAALGRAVRLGLGGAGRPHRRDGDALLRPAVRRSSAATPRCAPRATACGSPRPSRCWGRRSR